MGVIVTAPKPFHSEERIQPYDVQESMISNVFDDDDPQPTLTSITQYTMNGQSPSTASGSQDSGVSWGAAPPEVPTEDNLAGQWKKVKETWMNESSKLVPSKDQDEDEDKDKMMVVDKVIGLWIDALGWNVDGSRGQGSGLGLKHEILDLLWENFEGNYLSAPMMGRA